MFLEQNISIAYWEAYCSKSLFPVVRIRSCWFFYRGLLSCKIFTCSLKCYRSGKVFLPAFILRIWDFESLHRLFICFLYYIPLCLFWEKISFFQGQGAVLSIQENALCKYNLLSMTSLSWGTKLWMLEWVMERGCVVTNPSPRGAFPPNSNKGPNPQGYIKKEGRWVDCCRRTKGIQLHIPHSDMKPWEWP